MIANNLRVAIIEYHNSAQGSNPYTNPYSTARKSFYGSSGNPDAFFDGVQRVTGGYPAPTSMYSNYLPKYNIRQAILSDFTIQKTISLDSVDHYTAHIVVNKVGNPTATNMKLMVVFTESHRLHNWGSGLTEVNHICRLIVPTAAGTVLDFSSSNTLSFDIPFTIDPTWVFNNMEMDVFVQNFANKEVLQGTSAPLSALFVGLEPVVKNDFNLNVYPNPFNNEATIAFDLKETSTAVLNIYDIVGKNVYSNNLGTVNPGVNFVDFDGSNLETGMYIIKLTVNNQTVTKKITINK
jgi:hypothetical protein